MYDFALLTKQQLEDAGFTIDLQVVDWATLVKRRNNPKEYDAFTTGIGAFYDPTHPVLLTATGRAGPATRRSSGCSRAGAGDRPQEALRAVGAEHRHFYEKVPVDPLRRPVRAPRGLRRRVKGFNEKTERPRFYNVWLEK